MAARRDGQDLRLIDSHAHFWDPTKAHYPWMSTAPDVFRQPYGPADLLPTLAALGVEATILVQARSSLDETRQLLQAAADSDLVAGVVGWVDLTAADVAETIAWLRHGPGGDRLVGIRHQINEEADPRWLCRPDVRRGLSAVQDADLCFDLLVWAREMPAALELATQMPGLRFVLDHMGKPAVMAGRDEAWSRMIREFRRLDNCAVKLCGIAEEADVRRWTIEDLRPFVDVVLDCFGPSRVMFGSDWPVCLVAVSYDRWLECAEQLTGSLSGPEKADIFAGTAAAVYRLSPRGRGPAA
jgi:L-fuconolactonase